MPKFYLICLIVAQILLVQAMAGDSQRSQLIQDSPTDRPLSLPPKPSETETDDSEPSIVASAPEIRRLGKHHVDKSVAGGGVIIGGLVTAIFAAVFCYIRVTRKREGGDAAH